MGLKSPGPAGVFVLATGRIRATRHCSGMVDVLSEWLIHPEQAGARRRRNHGALRSRPSAVGLRLSRMEKMSASWQGVKFGDAVSLSIGGRYPESVEAAA